MKNTRLRDSRPVGVLQVVVLASLFIAGAGLTAPAGALEEEDPVAAVGTLRVSRAVPGGPAATAGVKADDLLLRLGERALSTFDALQKALATHQAGDTVSLWVQRGDKEVMLEVVLGPRTNGGTSLGIQLEIELGADGVPDEGTERCLEKTEQTYQITSIIQKYQLEFLAEQYESIRTCMERDTRRMTTENAVRFCENVFKVHCSGDQLLGELGEAQVEACEQSLGKSLNRDLRQDRRWTTCAKNWIFDGYSQGGKLGDPAACRAALEACSEPAEGEKASGSENEV